MINVKEEKTSAAISTRTSTQATTPLEARKNPSATVVNFWIRSFNKWLEVLQQWKTEARLIDRLINLDILGEEKEYSVLDKMHTELKNLMNAEVSHLETEILDMQQNLDLLQRYVINTDVKVKELKTRMQNLSESYNGLKLKIFKELTKVYPMTIL